MKGGEKQKAVFGSNWQNFCIIASNTTKSDIFFFGFYTISLLKVYNAK